MVNCYASNLDRDGSRMERNTPLIPTHILNIWWINISWSQCKIHAQKRLRTRSKKALPHQESTYKICFHWLRLRNNSLWRYTNRTNCVWVADHNSPICFFSLKELTFLYSTALWGDATWCHYKSPKPSQTYMYFFKTLVILQWLGKDTWKNSNLSRTAPRLHPKPVDRNFSASSHFWWFTVLPWIRFIASSISGGGDIGLSFLTKK